MRSIMRVGATVFALLVAANVAVAQDGGGRRGGGGRGGAGQLTQLMANITLTDAQKAQADSAVAWYDAERAKLPQMGRGGGDAPPPDSAARAAAMAANMKLQTDFRAKLKAILTPEQQTTFDTNAAAMPVGGRGGRRGGGL
jgi:Spy/CpxP family protein refolding chaperone